LPPSAGVFEPPIDTPPSTTPPTSTPTTSAPGQGNSNAGATSVGDATAGRVSSVHGNRVAPDSGSAATISRNGGAGTLRAMPEGGSERSLPLVLTGLALVASVAVGAVLLLVRRRRRVA
jgi:hypothetical protein